MRLLIHIKLLIICILTIRIKTLYTYTQGHTIVILNIYSIYIHVERHVVLYIIRANLRALPICCLSIVALLYFFSSNFFKQ